MRKIVLIASLVVIPLAGCGTVGEEKTVSVCKEMLGRTVINPEKLQINEVSVTNAVLNQKDATAVLVDTQGSELTESQAAALAAKYQPEGQQPKEHFVSIDYTDEGGITPYRGKALCRYYMDDSGGDRLVSANLAGGIQASGAKGMLDFFIIYGKIANISPVGEVE